ncbi:MAG TPA: hypothetical protein PKV73_06955 [Agriterribacter sp.]|nr:hypothetical protein [Chitinophagaceae bacterium]HRP31611.1 hypothetical protein [Agriterribacter sp.]
MFAAFYIVIGLIYSAGFVLLFLRLNEKLGSPLDKKWLSGAFAAKLLAGIVYGYLYAHVFETSDSWLYFRESLAEYQKLLKQPLAFFTSGLHFNNAGDFFSSSDDAAWSNAGENLLIKLLAIFNVFSGGNYYVNVVLFNAFSFYGLYRLFLVTAAYSPKNKLLLFGILFFLPSCLYWNSGIDKDGLILFFTGQLIFTANAGIRGKVTVKGWAIALISFLFIYLFRNVNAVLLLPALAAWWLSAKIVRKPWLVFTGLYGVCILFFFLSAHFRPVFNLPLRLAEKQHQFLALKANTVLPLTPLEPTTASYVRVFPEAVNHVLLRPYISEIKSPFHFMAFMELLLILFVIIVAIKRSGKHLLQQIGQPYYLFLLFVAISGLLLIGYTVPFPGAIVRYKALYIIFLLLPLCCYVKPGADNK